MAEQIRVDALADPGGDGANDLADALARQHMRCRPGAGLTAGEQRSGPPRADVQPQQLRQIAPDRHLPTLSTLALADRDHALGEADVLDPELNQRGRAGTGLQQGLQHQPCAAVLGVGLVEEAQFLFDAQLVDAAGDGAKRGPHSSTASCSIIRLKALTPAVRQKRSKFAPTCRQASATAASGLPVAVSLLLSMALLSFVDSAPRAYRLKAGNAAWKVSTDAGTSPA